MILTVLAHAMLSERKYQDGAPPDEPAQKEEHCELGYAEDTNEQGDPECAEVAQVADVVFPHEDECALMLQSRLITNDVACPRG